MAPNNENDKDLKVTTEETQAALKGEYQDILRKNGITDEISEVVISSPDLKGEHLGSLIELVETKFENGSPSKHFFVKKILPAPCGSTEFLAESIKNMVTMEGSFLLEFTAEMKSVCKTRGAENGLESKMDDLFPRAYHYDTEKVVMENLCERGFVMLPKKDRLDLNHCNLVLKNLAKFHGVTYVMIKDAGGSQEFLKSHPNLEEKMVLKGMQEFFSGTFEPTWAIVLQVLQNCSHPEKEEKINMLKKFMGNIGKTMGEVCGAQSLFDVVYHGDLWSNNIMFEGEGPEHTNLKFVDLQMPCVGSPNLDIGYFFFISVRPEDRKRWRELLQIYFDELKKIVQSLGQSFDHTFEEFVEDFKVKSKLGFIFGIILVMGVEAMAGHDAEDLKGDVPFDQMFTQLFQKFVEENPDKVAQVAENVITMVNDFLEFGQLE